MVSFITREAMFLVPVALTAKLQGIISYPCGER